MNNSIQKKYFQWLHEHFDQAKTGIHSRVLFQDRLK